MKKTLLTLLTAFSALFMVSCDDDDDDYEVTTLVGEVVTYNGHKAVELGGTSGILWATENVSDALAWGETAEKSDYSLDTYSVYSYNSTDKLTTLESTDDVATQSWGGEWRMPTLSEMQELLTYCTWTWTDNYNGQSGYIVGGMSNTIFFPAAGYHDGTATNYDGIYGYYWVSTLKDYDNAQCLIFQSNYGGVYTSTDVRYKGFCVRPVVSASAISE